VATAGRFGNIAAGSRERTGRRRRAGSSAGRASRSLGSGRGSLRDVSPKLRLGVIGALGYNLLGSIGRVATFHSIRMNAISAHPPMTNMLITMGESQGK